MPTSNEEKDFAEIMRDSVDEVKMSSMSLTNAIDWISKKMNPEEVYSDKQLSEWAEGNGYLKQQ